MKEQVYEQLTLFPADSHASPSLLPEDAQARKMTVTSGLKCLESYKNSSPLGCLVKMCLESSIWHSTRCFLNWKMQVTPHKRSLFRLVASTPRTKENDVQFWPTPSVGAALCGGTGNFKTLKKMAEKGLITEEERRQLSQGNGGKTNPQLLEWLMGYEQAFTQLIPTPTATDYKGGAMTRWYPSGSYKTVTNLGGGGAAQQVLCTSERISGMHSAWENWPDEPQLDRVVDGVPNRVDRIKCLGNAVVPQQFFPFFLAIVNIENEKE